MKMCDMLIAMPSHDKHTVCISYYLEMCVLYSTRFYLGKTLANQLFQSTVCGKILEGKNWRIVNHSLIIFVVEIQESFHKCLKF